MAKVPTLVHDCPNPTCGSRNQGFTILAHHEGHRSSEGVRLPNGQFATGVTLDYLVFYCQHCHSPLTVELARLGQISAVAIAPAIAKDFKHPNLQIMRIFPVVTPAEDLPEHVPETVGSPYNQACRSLRGKDYDLAGMGFRRSLDLATKVMLRQIDPAPSNLDKLLHAKLVLRIDRLFEAGKLTEDVKEWAHIVRVDGNEAAHDEPPFSQEDAESIHHFTRVLLMYVFTMPALVAAHNAPPTP